MRDIITPTYTTLGMVFEKNFLFEVPKYQRYYSWEDEQVDDYIKDIKSLYSHASEQEVEHFFGGIVVVEKTIAGSNRQQRELIDGQQRITTTILLIISLIRKYEALKNEGNKTLVNSRIEKLKTKYLWYDDEINRQPQKVPKLVLSKADRQYFENLVSGVPCTESRDSHKRIHKAFKKIERFVDSCIASAEDPDKQIDVLATIEDIIHNNCTIIFIDAKTRDSAYKLFQVLNDRGAGLTEGDLLKSKTLEVLEKHFSIKQASIETAWDEILQDEPKQVEQFLRYYYASVCGNRVGRTTLYDDFLKRFFPSIVELSDITDEGDATVVVDSVNEILREMRIYRKISSGEWPYEAAQPVTEWDRKRLDVLVNFLDFDIVYPLLLAATQLKQKTFAELVHMLEKFMFRYKSVCNLGHQKLSDLYMQEAVKIRNDPTAYSLGGLKTVLKRFMTTECTNEVFTAGLSNMRYRTTGSNKQLRYFFSTLNEYIEWYRDGANGKPQANTSIVINYDNVTIEHICSQSDDATQAGFTEETKHNISNLTILTAVENNDKVRNKKYVEKQPIYVDSSYVINRYFSDVATWDQAESEKWLSYIKDAACKIFVV